MALASVKVKPEWKLDGVDLLPYLYGEKTGAPHDALYWRLGPQMAIRMGDYKLVRYDRNADTPALGRNSVTAQSFTASVTTSVKPRISRPRCPTR